MKTSGKEFLTSALHGAGGNPHTASRFAPVKELRQVLETLWLIGRRQNHLPASESDIKRDSAFIVLLLYRDFLNGICHCSTYGPFLCDGRSGSDCRCSHLPWVVVHEIYISMLHLLLGFDSKYLKTVLVLHRGVSCCSVLLKEARVLPLGHRSSISVSLDHLKNLTQWPNLMFFWPCIMNWLYINYQLDVLIIIYS